MSPKVKIRRRVVNPPPIKGFKPYGPDSAKRSTEPVALFYEEYEALRLCDYDGLNHTLASLEMGVSRPTFTRVYAAALQKVATAFVEGRQISIGGGRVYFDSEWFHCPKCSCQFNNPQKDRDITHCPLCGNDHIHPADHREVCPKCHGRRRRKGQINPIHER